MRKIIHRRENPAGLQNSERFTDLHPYRSWMRHSLAVAATSAGIATELSPGHYQFTDVTTAAVQRFYVVRLR
jgi:hypothetical protein